MLIIDLCLCCLDQLLKLSNLELEELNCVLCRSLLSLKGLGELQHRLKLAGKEDVLLGSVIEVMFW